MRFFKFPLDTRHHVFMMPATWRVLTVQNESGYPCLWAMGDPDDPPVARYFSVYEASDETLDVGSLSLEYIGTCTPSMERDTIHVFEACHVGRNRVAKRPKVCLALVTHQDSAPAPAAFIEQCVELANITHVACGFDVLPLIKETCSALKLKLIVAPYRIESRERALWAFKYLGNRQTPAWLLVDSPESLRRGLLKSSAAPNE